MQGRVIDQTAVIWASAVVLAFSTTLKVQAENLVEIAQTPNSYPVYLDTDSVRTSGHIKKYWITVIEPLDNKSKATYSKRYWGTDCNKELITYLGSIFYTDDGDVVSNDIDLNRPAKWYPIIPGSNGETIMSVVCAAK